MSSGHIYQPPGLFGDDFNGAAEEAWRRIAFLFSRSEDSLRVALARTQRSVAVSITCCQRTFIEHNHYNDVQ